MAPQRIHAPEPPQAMWREAEIATDDLKATTGIYDASLGAKSNETSGVAIKRREDQGDTANFHYQDNLTLSIEHTGRILIDLIPKIYDNQRVVRLLTEAGDASMVPINHVIYSDNGQSMMLNDLSVGRFDIRVTIGPSYQTKRLEAAQSIVELMSALGPQVAPLLADIAVRNMDIPDAEEAANRLRAIANASLPPDPNAPPDPAQQQMQMLQMAAHKPRWRRTRARRRAFPSITPSRRASCTARTSITRSRSSKSKRQSPTLTSVAGRLIPTPTTGSRHDA